MRADRGRPARVSLPSQRGLHLLHLLHGALGPHPRPSHAYARGRITMIRHMVLLGAGTLGGHQRGDGFSGTCGFGA
jgi:hypothetical protein